MPSQMPLIILYVFTQPLRHAWDVTRSISKQRTTDVNLVFSFY